MTHLISLVSNLFTNEFSWSLIANVLFLPKSCIQICIIIVVVNL